MPDRRKSEQRQRRAMVSVRFTLAEFAEVRSAATGPLSGWLRRIALAGRQPAVPSPVTVNGTWQGRGAGTYVTITPEKAEREASGGH